PYGAARAHAAHARSARAHTHARFARIRRAAGPRPRAHFAHVELRPRAARLEVRGPHRYRREPMQWAHTTKLSAGRTAVSAAPRRRYAPTCVGGGHPVPTRAMMRPSTMMATTRSPMWALFFGLAVSACVKEMPPDHPRDRRAPEDDIEIVTA